MYQTGIDRIPNVLSSDSNTSGSDSDSDVSTVSCASDESESLEAKADPEFWSWTCDWLARQLAGVHAVHKVEAVREVYVGMCLVVHAFPGDASDSAWTEPTSVPPWPTLQDPRDDVSKLRWSAAPDVAVSQSNIIGKWTAPCPDVFEAATPVIPLAWHR